MAPTLIRLGLICTAAATLAAGCGSNKPATLTKAEVIKRGTAICKAAERSASDLAEPTTEHPFARSSPASVQKQARQWLIGMADALDSSRAGLLGLPAPAEDRDLLDGYLKDIGTVVIRLRAASTAPAANAEQQAMAAMGLFERASSQTARYGFPKGVCGAGDS